MVLLVFAIWTYLCHQAVRVWRLKNMFHQRPVLRTFSFFVVCRLPAPGDQYKNSVLGHRHHAAGFSMLCPCMVTSGFPELDAFMATLGLLLFQ